MAFATFCSSEETRQVVQRLHGQLASGRRLNVQYKRKRPEIMAGDDSSSRDTLQSNRYPHPEGQEETYSCPQTKVSSATKAAREQKPSSEAYDLLMQYQTEPVEKEKLKKFLARTGDYQEAVNEFAKNRVRETEEGGYLTSAEIPPILEMRPATLGELEQIADMENSFGFGGEASVTGSQSIKIARDTDVTNMVGDKMPETVKLASHGHRDEMRFPEQKVALDEGKDIVVLEKERVEDGHEKQRAWNTGQTRGGDACGSKELPCQG